VSKFKGSNGKYKTVSLFLEHDYKPDVAIFTDKEEDLDYNGKVFPSAKRLFVGLGDPTGYMFSQEYLGGWKHWQTLLKSAVTRRYIEAWQEEVEVSLRAEAIRHVVDASKSGGQSGTSAAKWLAEKGYAPKVDGRKATKEDKVKEEKQLLASVKEAEELAARLH